MSEGQEMKIVGMRVLGTSERYMVGKKSPDHRKGTFGIGDRKVVEIIAAPTGADVNVLFEDGTIDGFGCCPVVIMYEPVPAEEEAPAASEEAPAPATGTGVAPTEPESAPPTEAEPEPAPEPARGQPASETSVPLVEPENPAKDMINTEGVERATQGVKTPDGRTFLTGPDGVKAGE